MRRPSVEFQPHVNKYLLHGVDLIANIVRPTLGPRSRYVAYEQITRTRTPEFISDAGTLVRRIIQVGDDASDVGAMLMRQAIWQVGERVGDGTATTAVLAQAMIHDAYRMVAAGANPMRVRDGIRLGLANAIPALRAQATPVVSQKDLTQIARSYCHDDELARLLGEIYTIIGDGGYVEVQNSHGLTLERQYIEGSYWRSTGWLSSTFGDKAMRRIELQDVALMLVDGRINNVEAIAGAIGRVLAAGHTNIGIVCRGMSDIVISVLAHNHQKGAFKCLPVQAQALSDDRKAMFDDLAVLTGATVLHSGDDADMNYFAADMLGKARRLWADPTQFGVVAGKGSPKEVRAHIAMLRRRLPEAINMNEKDALHKRLGRLMGGTALLDVGARTEAEQKQRKELAERSVHFMHTVSAAGMAPGGGAAYLACQSAVEKVIPEDEDIAAGVRAVKRALEEPMRALAHNAGFEESATVQRARNAGPGYGLNVLTGDIEEMRKAGIVDSANVLEQALASAASVTSMVLTTDVVIRHRKPEYSSEP